MSPVAQLPQPRTAFLSPTTPHLLEALPPMLREAVDVQAALDALAMEQNRLDAAAAAIRDAAFPPFIEEEYLKLWESLMGVPTEPPDKTLEERRKTVIAFMQSLKSRGEGREWQEQLSLLIGSGWQYQENDPDAAGGPPPNTLWITLPYSIEIQPPADLAATPGTGGTLPAGDYYYVVTATNFYGETNALDPPGGAYPGAGYPRLTLFPSSPVTGEVGAVVDANGTITLTWEAVPGATGYRVYRGDVPGNPRLLAAPGTNTYIDTGAVTTGPEAPPTTNTTASFQATEARMLAHRVTPAHLEIVFIYGTSFIVGIDVLGDTL